MSERRRRAEAGLSQTGEFLARTAALDPRLGVVLSIARSLSTQLRQDELLQIIMSGVSELLDAERSTLFLLGPDGQTLWSSVAEAEDLIDIRLPVGEGIARWVAATGRDLNIRDVYQDPRFDPTWDQVHNFRTSSMLCQALRHRDGTIIGVAQAINKRTGYFTVDDEFMMRTIMAMAAISVVNSDLTRNLLSRNMELQSARNELQERVREIDLLYQIEREVAEAESLEVALELLLHELQRALPCEVAQVALLAPAGRVVTHRLRRDDGEVERVMFETRSGYVTQVLGGGHGRSVCEGGDAIDEQLASEEGFGFTPSSGLTTPLQADDGVIGALGLYGRSAPVACFDEADVKLISVAAASVARIVARFQARERDERQGRLASLGRTLSMVLHDFRTPMTIASGYVQMMALNPDQAQREQLAATVLRQLDRVVQMSREVLDFARGTRELLVQKVMLADFASEAEELVRQVFADTDVEVRVEALDRGVARLDGFKLLRVVQNLARNARDAMASGPSARARGHFTLRIVGEGDDVVFWFVDDGPGVPDSFLPRMFEAFASHGKEEGTGLGLAMVRQFAESHGGSVSHQETPGGGATFLVRIPRNGPTVSRQLPPPAA